MRVLVCGDRNWTDQETIRDYLRGLRPGTVIVHGAARGADSLAGVIAETLGLSVEAFPAEWDQYGPAAGPIRNRQMLDTLTPPEDHVAAFHDNLAASKGTKDCVTEAERRGIRAKVLKSRAIVSPISG